MPCCFFSAATASATHTGSVGEIYLTPLTQNVALSNQASVDLWMDFSLDRTLGGGLDLNYDSTILQFAGFIFDATLPDESGYRILPTNWTGGVDALNVGNFGSMGGSHLG